MKQFVFKLALFLLLCVLCDLALGSIYKLYDYTKGGEISKMHELMTSSTPKILVLGSSRASHHYVSSIMTDSLNLPTYNGGMDGQGIPVAYGIFKGISQRVMPKIIIFELHPPFDIYEGYSPALDNFYPYLFVDGIKPLIKSFDKKEMLKLKSNAYKYNSKLLRLIPNIVLKRDNAMDDNGYEPLYNILNPKDLKQINPHTARETSQVKVKWLRMLIEEADAAGCKIIFAISPEFKGGDIDQYSDEIAIIQEYGKPILNYVNDERFINDPQYFQDRTHLNNNGAIKYTECVIKDIKPLIESD